MRRNPLTVVAGLLVLALGLAFASAPSRIPLIDQPDRIDADANPGLSDELRARSFAYAPGAGPDIQAWVATTMARVHPAARRLIEAVDGQVTVQVHPHNGRAAGFVRPLPDGFILSLDAQMLALGGQEIRDHVIAHELGHVVDLALVPAALNARLDLAVPRIGGCDGESRDAGCAPAEERFADTFAKWALNDPVVLAGANSVGYRVAPPPNLALWGEPLVDLPV